MGIRGGLGTSARPTAGGPRGHRTLPHTADLRLHAWAETRDECVAEAVLALVGGFADTTAAAVTGTVVAEIVAGDDEGLLVAALDEVVCLVDTAGVVPVTVATEPVAGGLRLLLGVADLARIESTGPAPKGVTRSALRFGPTPTGWSCEVTVDV